MAASAFFGFITTSGLSLHRKEADAVVFSTIIFLLRFLPITLALYYLAPPKLKNTVLFLCSLVFYCWGEVRFFPVMLALILINYLCGLGLERFEQNKTARLILLLIALAGSLGMLFYFKYANFVLSSINAIFGTGFASIQGISVLPLGISFYTFQTLSYTIDVYRRDVKRSITSSISVLTSSCSPAHRRPHRQVPGRLRPSPRLQRPL